MERIGFFDRPQIRAQILDTRRRYPAWSSRQLFQWLLDEYPRHVQEAQLRTFLRRLKDWCRPDRLLSCLRASGQIHVFLGVREPNRGTGRNLHEGFDVETAATLGELAGGQYDRPHLDWVRIATDKPDRLDEFRNLPGSLIAVGSPRSNAFTEVLLCAMSGLRPDGLAKRPLGSHPFPIPFAFCWPRAGRFPSHFECRPEQLPTPFDKQTNDINSRTRQARPEDVRQERGYGFVLRGKSHFAFQKGQPGEWSRDFGVIVAAPHPKRGGALQVVLAGASGPGTLAAARVLVSDRIDCPLPPENDAGWVLCAAVVATVRWEKQCDLADIRRYDSAELLGRPFLWYPENGTTREC